MSRLAERAVHAAYFRLLSALENAVNTVGGGGLASVRVPHRVCGDPWLGARSLIAGSSHVEHHPAAVPARLDDPRPAGDGLLSDPVLRTHAQLVRLPAWRWFKWCETNRLDPLDGIQRARVELYIRHLGGCGLLPSYRALVPRLVQVEEVPDGSSNQGLDSATNMPRVR
jgi:hypothetical protein